MTGLEIHLDGDGCWPDLAEKQAAGKHVNKHPYCLHLWSCLDGPVLPDFTRGSDGI